MTAAAETGVTTQVYRVWIKATPEAIWDAITKPEWTEKYGYGGRTVYEGGLRPGATYQSFTSDEMKAAGAERGMPVPEVAVDGEVLEVDPPRKLVQTFRMLMDEGLAAEGFIRVTYEIEPVGDGVTRLTVSHGTEGTPTLALLLGGAAEAQGAGGGFGWVLSDLKSLLETGSAMAAS
jgi:uncharacterized protein YndB with AHSA1/START domain